MRTKQLRILPSGDFFIVYWGKKAKFGPTSLKACINFLNQNKPNPQARARKCLNCNHYFMSEHTGNRRCGRCKLQDSNVYLDGFYEVVERRFL